MGEVSRRAALAAGGGLVVLGAAGCAETYESPVGAAPSPEPVAPGGAAAAAADPAVLGPASGVPEGGGTIYASREVVVTQPSAGTYAGFSAICTHMRCLVSKVEDGTIYCPCHGSKFSIVDGSVKVGPATVPLPTRQVSEVDGNIRLT